MADDTIHTEAFVTASINGPLYCVSLPNGKKILAHLSKALAERDTIIDCGQKVRLELTPYDFDQARILGML